MLRFIFIGECKNCGFDVDDRVLAREDWKAHLPEDFHRFDVLIVDSLLYPNSNSDLLRRAAMIAKVLDRSLADIREVADYEIRVENAKRRENREKDPDALKSQRLVVGFEEDEWTTDVVREQWAKRWGDLKVDAIEARDMWEILRHKIRQYDGYWKSRWILYGQLSPDDLRALELNATGSMRYAHLLYRIGTYVGQYLSYLTGKPAPSMVIEGDVADIYEFSLCKYCGQKMKDLGKRKRQHCGKAKCKREYDRVRKSQQRSKMPA